MAISENFKYAFYAILLYLPTLANVRAEFFLIAIGAILFFERKALLSEAIAFKKNPFARNYLTSFWLIALLFLISLGNKIFNGIDILCLRDYYASFYLFPLLILISKFYGNPKVFKFLILITLLEVFVGVFEYFTGYRSVFFGSVDYNEIVDRSLLYNSRCFGLSANSSIFGYKILLAFILLEYVRISKLVAWLFRLLLLAGVLISFSRSVILVLIVFWIGRLVYGVYLGIKDRRVFYSPSFQFAAVLLFFTTVFYGQVVHQLFRGEHEAESVHQSILSPQERIDPTSCSETHAIDIVPGEMNPSHQGWGEKLMAPAENIQSSGRKLIWINYLNFIENNLLFGNGSSRMMLRSWQEKTEKYKLLHAHNSFLMLIAANGILIFGLYLLFYWFNFRSKNYLVLLTVLLYSLFNYGIFWGFSYLDVMFIVLLTLKFKDSYDCARED